jgi:hypothetical protein
LTLVLLFVLLVGGCFALLGVGGNQVSKSVDKSTVVTEGKGFTHDGFVVADGWKVGTDESGRTALLSFSFYDGKTNLAEVNCTSNELQAGETSKLDCGSTDDFPTGYKTIKVADLF